MTLDSRSEHDLLGDRDVPADAYYGVHTLRAVENFPITGIPFSTYPELIRALAYIKKAAALTNHHLGLIDTRRCDAIVKACDELLDGKLHEQFVVDVIQGGAGTTSWRWSRRWACSGAPSRPSPRSSATSSRWGARNCRTRSR
jgi:aspartate ammonia-lyase